MRRVAGTPSRRSIGWALAFSLFVSVMAAAPAEVRAEDGATLRQFTADLPPCSISTGIAFDGQDLLVSCWYTNELYVIDTTAGSLLDTIVVSDLSGIGALAWDRGRSQLWACDYPSESVYLITISGSTATAEFKFTPSDGCIDGLAYNGEDDSLFTSGDVRPTVYHYDVNGTLLDTRDVGGKIGDCNSSGIAIGGGDLFLANNGCQEIWRVANEQDAVPVLFASYPARLEDLECDDVTFAGEGKAAIWTKDAYDAVINAFELNPGDCGYGGLAPLHVQVALGDSYQSGEGVGNSIADTTAYLTTAYENGSNYPDQVGPQEDTYTFQLTGGNGCHRALANYAKINRDLYEPGAPATLVDETCSGAKIEPGDRPPIVGTVDGGVAVDSQITQTLNRLALEGASAEEVDLVTVGMGGNDAGFGDIVQACLLPTIVRKLLDEYPDPPPDLEGLIRVLVHCSTMDAALFQTGPRIDALQPKEEWGQKQLLAEFPNARILQLSYPNPLPSANDVKDWCSGIRPADLHYARKKVGAINDVIAASITSTGDGRLELVDVENAFGRNPLCPQDGSQALINGFAEPNVDREIQRLLNLTPDGDPIARQKVDTLVAEWEDHRACVLNKLNPFDGEDCDSGQTWADLIAAFNSLGEHLRGQTPLILANVVEPPGPDAESEAVRFDRSRGLMHPNMVGFEILACNVRAGYAGQGASDCLSDPAIVFDTVNGEEKGLSPIDVAIDEILDVIFNGFQSNTPVHITFHSETIDLGAVTADANGRIETSIQIPNTNPGVHSIQFAGSAAGGVELVKEVKVKVPGDPVPGVPYGVYLCCFLAGTAEDAAIEFVDVTFGGFTFTVVPNIEGGIFFEVPVPDASVDITIQAVSQLTGEQVTEQVTVGDPPGGMSQTWGRNSQGQLGNGTTNDSPTPVDVSDLADIVTIGAGGEHSVAALSDGTAWAWGQNANGQLGDGSLTDRTTPIQVSGLSGTIKVDGGLAHSLALRDDGTVWAWGLNANGQLGDGTTTDSTTPVQASGLSGVVAIAAGGDHSIALKSDGTVWAWGKNSDGQLGNGSKRKSSTPVQVSDLTGVVAIAAGDAHSLAVKSDGTVWAWGDNFYGQLGDGTSRDRNTPVQVTSLTGAEAVAGGSFHSLAAKSDGTVWGWGRNVFGQLGDGTTTDRATPVQTSNLSTAADISAGAHHSLAAQDDGSVWAWGLNLYGQLGDGTTTNRSTPVQAAGVTGVEEVSAGAFHSVAVD